MGSLALPPLALYVHIPWCVQKCPYCDFNSHAQPEVIPEAAYIACLLDDLDTDLHYAQGRSLSSIFIGGGTPSLMSAAAIERLLQGIAARIPLAPDIEITLEANPGTFEIERFNGFVEAGVNRLSIGVQSLNEHQLKQLGRVHNPAEARQAATHAAKLPLRSFNLDLMHGLPDQSVANALTDLEELITLSPPHISWYQLTIEPNTLFASRPPVLPAEDTLADIYERGDQLLRQAGYIQYEVSAYSKPGHAARHNTHYWQFGDYLGIGCGAHGKITLPQHKQILRTEKVRHPRGYLNLARPYLYRSWEVPEEERTFEYFMNRLRLLEPVPKTEFSARTGLSPQQASDILYPAIARGLVHDGPHYWETTPKGRLFLNEILTDLLASD